MKSPTNDEMNATLRRLEQTKMELVDDVDDDDGPQWQSDAAKQGLPVVNVVDTGAPLLDRDAVLRNSYPNYVKTR